MANPYQRICDPCVSKESFLKDPRLLSDLFIINYDAKRKNSHKNLKSEVEKKSDPLSLTKVNFTQNDYPPKIIEYRSVTGSKIASPFPASLFPLVFSSLSFCPVLPFPVSLFLPLSLFFSSYLVFFFSLRPPFCCFSF